jgi:hypothetical protein
MVNRRGFIPSEIGQFRTVSAAVQIAWQRSFKGTRSMPTRRGLNLIPNPPQAVTLWSNIRQQMIAAR